MTAITNLKSYTKFKLSTRIWKTPSEAGMTFSSLQRAYKQGLVDKKPQDNSFVFRLVKETK